MLLGPPIRLVTAIKRYREPVTPRIEPSYVDYDASYETSYAPPMAAEPHPPAPPMAAPYPHRPRFLERATRIPKRISSATKTLIEKPKKLLTDFSKSLRRSKHITPELRPAEKVVNTGFADRSRPEIPLDKNIPLASSTSYYFWLEVGEVIHESIEKTPIPLPTLPKEARLTVTLFSFENELEVLKTEQTGELRIQADGQVMVSRPAEIPDGLENDLLARRLFFETKTPPRGGSFRLRCNIYCEQVLLQSRPKSISKMTLRLIRLPSSNSLPFRDMA